MKTIEKSEIIELRINIMLTKMNFKGAFSGVRTENPLKMMRNGFYFTLKAIFVLEIFKFLF